VTAAFNLNLLRRLNRDLDADFDMDRFVHEARWNAKERRVEMHIVARIAHSVRIPAIDLVARFRERESIWTESSYNSSPASPGDWLGRQGSCSGTVARPGMALCREPAHRALAVLTIRRLDAYLTVELLERSHVYLWTLIQDAHHGHHRRTLPQSRLGHDEVDTRQRDLHRGASRE